ncbi:MAG TPA: helix-turn-helix transcriptional regulator [Acidimicrobiales bacterium]
MRIDRTEERRPRLNPPTLSEVADPEVIDRVFRALANPRRRQMLALLHDWGGFMNSAEFMRKIGGAWSGISRDLSILTEAGLIRYEVRGCEHAYTLERDNIRDVPGRWIDRVAAHPSWLKGGAMVFDYAE